MTIFWTATAVGQMQKIQSYINNHSKNRAGPLLERIIQHVEQLPVFPRVGRKLPEFRHDHVRELIELPYRLIYVIAPAEIIILAVFHAAMPLAEVHDVS